MSGGAAADDTIAAGEEIKDIKVLGIVSKSSENEEHIMWTCFISGGCKFQTTKSGYVVDHSGQDHMMLSWLCVTNVT